VSLADCFEDVRVRTEKSFFISGTAAKYHQLAKMRIAASLQLSIDMVAAELYGCCKSLLPLARAWTAKFQAACAQVAHAPRERKPSKS
jgi:hypothetical protein